MKNIEITETFKKFINLLYKKSFFTINDDSVHWNQKAFWNNKNWPSQLDTENFEVEEIYENLITGHAGGDWQEMTRFNIVYDEKENKIYLSMFDDPFCYTHGEKYKSKDIIKIINEKDTEKIKESLVDSFLKKFL